MSKNNKKIHDLSDEKISLAKLMIYLSIALFMGGTALDYFSAPQLIEKILLLRLSICTLLGSFILLIVYKPDLFLKFYDYAISVLFLTSSLTILSMIYLTDVNDIAHSTYFAGLMLIIITVFLGTYISTLLSVIISILIISAFLMLSIKMKNEFNLIVNNSFFLCSSLIVGIISNALKTTQLSRILLLQNSLKESLRNQHLETKKQSELARIDSITNIPNRRYGTQLLDKMLTNAEQLDMAVVTYFLDLNGFKQINDTYGHHIGDDVLSIVANRVLNSGRKSDVFYRQGGDEFIYAIMIKKQNIDFADTFKQVLKDVIAPNMEVDGLRLAITSSIGSAIYPTNGYSAATLLKIADEKMYKDKIEYKINKDDAIPPLNSLKGVSEYENRVLPFNKIKKNNRK